jgi:hypothetical protein
VKHEIHSIKIEHPSIVSTKAHFASTTLSVYTTGPKFVLKKIKQRTFTPDTS